MRTAALGATCICADLELRGLALLLNQSLLGHGLRLLEGEAEQPKQRPPLVVVCGGGDDGDVHATRAVDLVLVDLVEHGLFVETEGVVALAVELPRR